jgi:diketogulonate reductase-like aldo/keto reductase
MKREGVARHVGISNFDPELIEQAVKLATEPLVNNQIECHVYFDQSKTIAASRKRGLSVTAYSPVARGRVTSDAVLARIGKAHGRTAVQVCLRYLVQQDIIVIPKTSRTERLKENFAIFDFQLSPADMKAIAALASPRGNIVS